MNEDIRIKKEVLAEKLWEIKSRYFKLSQTKKKTSDEFNKMYDSLVATSNTILYEQDEQRILDVEKLTKMAEATLIREKMFNV